MDGSGFNALVALTAGLISRRRLGAAFGGVLAGFAGATAADAKPKKKKKPTCKKPNKKCGRKGCCKSNQLCFEGACLPVCQFTQTATRWTLKGDCTTLSTIEVPDGVTLDGNGKTITAAGLTEKYISYDGVSVHAVVLARAGSGGVENLTLRGGGLRNDVDESRYCVGVAVHESTVRIADVSVRDFPPETYSIGMRFSGSRTTADVRRCSITNVYHAGIEVDDGSEAVQVDIDEVEVTNVALWAILFYDAQGTITRSSLQSGSQVIVVSDSVVTIAENHLDPASWGVSVFGSTVEATGNTIVGAGQLRLVYYGIYYDDESVGTIANNKVSGFLYNDPNGTFEDPCGIRLAESSRVTLSSNEFPPPGNFRDVCRGTSF